MRDYIYILLYPAEHLARHTLQGYPVYQAIKETHTLLQKGNPPLWLDLVRMRSESRALRSVCSSLSLLSSGSRDSETETLRHGFPKSPEEQDRDLFIDPAAGAITELEFKMFSGNF